MWYYIGTIGISAMIVPILAGFFIKGKKSPIAAILSMISGSITSLLWVIHGYINAIEVALHSLGGISEFKIAHILSGTDNSKIGAYLPEDLKKAKAIKQAYEAGSLFKGD